MLVTRRLLISAPREPVERYLADRDGSPASARASRFRRLESRITIRPVNGGTVVQREDAYELPLLLKPLAPFVRRWLDQALERELHAIKEGAEALNRRIQLQNLEP